jgi:hypothetical protein
VQQLLSEQLQALRIASEFSDVPMTDWVDQDGCLIPIVACNNWIMPKDCFITFWFWIMAEGKVYSRHWHHAIWSQILLELNTHNHVPDKYKEKVLEWIYVKMCQKFLTWDLQFKYDQFERVLKELTETEPS